MASHPPFELEDQTDADFFDNLVDDDDDDDIAVPGPTSSSPGLGSSSSVLPKTDDLSDGNDSDEAKLFANLSISNNNGNEGLEPKGLKEGDGNVVGVESKQELRVDSDPSAHGHVSEDGVLTSEVSFEFGGESGADANPGEQKVESKEPPVVHQDPANSLVSSGSFSFDNGHVSESGSITTPEANTGLRRESSGVKQVQWGAFGESGEHDKDGFGSYSDFFTTLGGEEAVENLQGDAKSGIGVEATETTNAQESSFSHYGEYKAESGAVVADQSATGEDVNSAQYWENLYPGWRYDPSTGQWYQLDGSDGAAVTGGDTYQAVSDVQSSQEYYAQQTAPSSVETVSQFCASENVSDWNNNVTQQNGEYQYPAHMVFDPQYPGWYYDTIAQEWRSLSDYHSAAQSTDHARNQLDQNGFLSGTDHGHGDSKSNNNAFQSPSGDGLNQTWGAATSLGDYGQQGQSNNNAFQSPGSKGLNQTWAATSFGDYGQSNNNAFQSPSSEGLNQTWAPTSFGDYSQQGQSNYNAFQSPVSQGVNQTWPATSLGDSTVGRSWESSYDRNLYPNNVVNQPKSFNSKETTPSDGFSSWSGGASQGFVPAGSFHQFDSKQQGQQNGVVQHQTDYYGGQIASSYAQPLFPNAQHAGYSQNEGRSSAGHPPHALVTFGFGGKLIVMKDNAGGFSSFGSKDSDGRSISVCNFTDVVGATNSSLGTGASSSTYLQSLCHQSFPGPFVGGNVGTKDLNRWIDERIASCEAPDMDYRKSKTLKLLLSLLKVACQHYGKLRSFGADSGLKESDLPETAVAKLFASAKNQGDPFSQHGTTTKCFVTLPSEAQIQATASEVQELLISGRKMEALQRAQQGQLWEFALILSRQLGDQFYADTVKQMAISQLAIGTPLRTLCLLIAKKPEEVFANNIVAGGNMHAPQPAESMLDNWEENLAVITANRTENDHLVIIHLGDSLWKEKNDVTAAHVCYLVAEADFELYSESARLCLIGADHLSFPRTYASPEAIQRTEFFEYTKALGNSQFVLLPLQPYKLVYAHMLAEVGRVSDSLKYCQAIYKSLKTGRSHEADTLKQLLAALEERIKTHQQSGYAANLAPAKIVGKLLNFFDSTAHRVVGGLPPPAPSTQGSIQSNEQHFQTVGSKSLDSKSTMTMSSLTPSASMEPISQWAVDGSKMTLQNRSISEPNIGRIPKSDQADLSNEATSSGGEAKQSSSAAGTSRFGRLNFGAQVLQKTVGLLRRGRQAKLGESNKFYYDEKLKRWVEEGAEPPAEEAAPPPPPTTAAFLNGTSDYNLNNALSGQRPATGGGLGSGPEPSSSSAPLGPGTPAMPLPGLPPTSNQFSARGRMNVRSRYVDTFNKGGNSAPTNTFQAPTAPSAKPASVGGAKFFIPTAAPSNEQALGTEPSSTRDESAVGNGENSSMLLPMNDPFQNLAPSPPTGNMQRFPSFDHISNKGTPATGNHNSLGSHSRRTSSLSDIHSNAYTPPTTTEMKASSPLSFVPRTHSGASLPMNGGGSFGDDLQEVEL